MKKANKNSLFKTSLLALALVALCIPYVKYLAEPLQEIELTGSFTIYEKPVFKIKSWLQGIYQPKFDRFYNQNFCLNSSYIKFNNQFFYAVFNESTSESIVLGRDNYLFEKTYIDSYTGEDFLGEEKLDSIVTNLKIIQQQLEQNNSEFVLVIAPSKTTVFHEFFPVKYRNIKPTQTNYDYLRAALKKEKINHIDVNAWFNSIKDADKFYFTKYGTHWSVYSSVLASDSLFNYIAHKKNIPSPRIVIDSLTYSTIAVESDKDILAVLNLYGNPPQEKYCYPIYHIEEDATFKQLKWLAVGDSFYWNIYNVINEKQVLNKHSFWYYSKRLFPESTTKETPITPAFILEDIKKHDVVVMITAETNINKLPYKLENRAK